MANSLVQFRIDDGLRQQASDLCLKLGLDLSTYLRMSLAKLVQEQGVPFAVKLSAAPTAEEAKAAMRQLSDISQANGNSQMTLAEINAEIAAARGGK
ncbi:MAG: type II toxin-antitoxin system RelB/DinJ family antitoxin [Planctomycetes bacterium]|nr:type II toxin-antitoxin system RelB/DinJ family antitoxin [Planctomycetota bacterium]